MYYLTRKAPRHRPKKGVQVGQRVFARGDLGSLHEEPDFRRATLYDHEGDAERVANFWDADGWQVKQLTGPQGDE